MREVDYGSVAVAEGGAAALGGAAVDSESGGGDDGGGALVALDDAGRAPLALSDYYTSGEERDAYLSAVRSCLQSFHDYLGFSQIYSSDDFQAVLERAGAGVASGEFFLARYGHMAEGDTKLALTLLVMRQRLIEEHGVRGMAELLLVDQAMIDVYHTLRMHELLTALETRVELHVYAKTTPHRLTPLEQDQLTDTLSRIGDRIVPALTRMQEALRRNLRELRRYRQTVREVPGADAPG